MGRKKKKKKAVEETTGHRSKGSSRAALVLQIVATDSTFELFVDRDGRRLWCGKCIHCNKKMTVLEDGASFATIEHINPLCAGGESHDPRNLALACHRCNSEKGIRHDQHVGKGGRADEVVTALQGKRLARWREPVQ